jgi:hypothetical protein
MTGCERLRALCKPSRYLSRGEVSNEVVTPIFGEDIDSGIVSLEDNHMEGNSILGMIAVGLVYALIISLPILIIIVVARVIRRMVSPHDKEMQQLLEKAVSLLEENNRLLNQQIAGKYSEEKQATAPPPGTAL